MATLPAEPAAPSWKELLRDWAAGEGRAWTFVFKTLLSALLALWLAFRLGFDAPRSAMTTVFIVAQPQTGLVLAKSFYRIIGTFVGCLATLLLVGLFAQQRELFLAAMALWVGFCCVGAALYRNFRAYGFILAGYTTCLIGFPSAMRPDAVFETAVARVSEVMLGIICAGVVADLLLPQRMSRNLVATVRASYRDFVVFVDRAMCGRLDHASIEQAHDRFLAEVMAFEAQRDAAYFESPDARVRADRLRLLNAEFMAVTTTVHTQHQLMQRLRRNEHRQALAALAPMYKALAQELLPDGRAPATAAEAAPVALRLAAFRDGLTDRVAAARIALETGDEEELLAFDSAAAMFCRLTEELHDYTASYAALAHPARQARKPAPRYVPHTDPITAVLSGVRATAALLVVSAFWIASAWPNGTDAATLACVGCCLFAAAPQPVLAVRMLTRGFLWGLLAAFCCAFFVLPHLDGFLLLALGMAPFIMVGTKLLTNPATAGIGAGYNIMFSTTVGVENVTRFDPVALLSSGIASLLGVTVAGLAFALLVPADAPRLRLHLVRSLRRKVLLASFGRLQGLRHRFENGTRDLLSQLLAGAARGSGEDRRLLRRGLAVLEVGHTVIGLRQDAESGALTVNNRAALHAGLRAQARFFSKPTPQRRAQALDGILRVRGRIETALEQHGLDAPERAALRRIHIGLHQLRSLLLDEETYEALSAVERAAAPPEPAHAA
ncbi:MAG: FUSC family protein [Nevskia sp.]|nr:FUSC family protein [Nevskia sp.]